MTADVKMTVLNKEMGRADSCKINSLNLIENMAEVSYIMSDKTGTMTKNELTFVAACADEQGSHRFGKTYLAAGRNERVVEQPLSDYMRDKTEFVKCIKICHDCTILSMKDKKG